MQRSNIVIQHIDFVYLFINVIMSAEPYFIFDCLFNFTKPYFRRTINIRRKFFFLYFNGWKLEFRFIYFSLSFLSFCLRSSHKKRSCHLLKSFL